VEKSSETSGLGESSTALASIEEVSSKSSVSINTDDDLTVSASVNNEHLTVNASFNNKDLSFNASFYKPVLEDHVDEALRDSAEKEYVDKMIETLYDDLQGLLGDIMLSLVQVLN